MSEAPQHLLFVGGLSGSGRTTAMGALEDLGYYGVDNIPPQLIDPFLALCAKSTPPIAQVAMALDAREEGFLRGFPATLETLRQSGTHAEVLFLDCRNEVLQSRYRETRRVHPLAPAGPVEAGIERERELLDDLARLADHTIDTSDLNVHQLRDAVLRHASQKALSCTPHIVSFGFRHGIPPSAELLFDVRVLRNPHFEATLRAKSGLDSAVRDFVLGDERSRDVVDRIADFLEHHLRLYDQEGKAYLHVGIGCTGGRHRSVAVAEALAVRLERDVRVTHRDVRKSESAGAQ